MKNNIKTILAVITVFIALVSCDIKVERPFAGDLTIELKGLPDDVKAVALFCNLNEWKTELVNGTGFIQEVKSGSVSFTPTSTEGLGGYIFSEELQCQFVPMKSLSTVLDGSWWSKAVSGSGTYANAKNNLVYNFASRGAANPMSLSLDVSDKHADLFLNRIHYENYGTALTPKF